jgi:hypothetical protein
VTPPGHLILSGNYSLCYNYGYGNLFYEVTVFMDEGRQIKETGYHNEGTRSSVVD